MKINLIPETEFRRIWASDMPGSLKLSVIADMCRANTLAVIKRAGSGHIGSSFSSMDIMVTLFYSVMNTVKKGIEHQDRDIFYSSKGHDAPAFYSVLYSAGILAEDQFINLRRINGVCGHPDIRTPGVEANTGSLGMGISKAKGFAMAKKLSGNGGRIFVLTGDGEFQEGQIYEALQTAFHHRIGNLTVIMDHNKVQSDKKVSEICALANLEEKIRAFGWKVERCDGHESETLQSGLKSLEGAKDIPKLLIADTIKGKGVSFMEHTADMEKNNGLYVWHSGAPDNGSFETGYAELADRVNSVLATSGLEQLRFRDITPQSVNTKTTESESLPETFGKELVRIATKKRKVVVLDCDLASDCGLRAFEEKFPERFVENGIAEQDMVSMAGGLALQGFIPVVNSFGAFLASRANEQIYNNATENTKIVYVCHYAGLFPAGPGYSHQSVRDISLFKSLPEIEILQPCNARETEMALRYCICEAKSATMLRLFLGKTPGMIKLPDDYVFKKGRGAVIQQGRDCVIFAYGPVMLTEALKTAVLLNKQGITAKIINMPWLNKIDSQWLKSEIGATEHVYVMEDHAPSGGVIDLLHANSSVCKDMRLRQFAVCGLPAWGLPDEVLRHHGLDAERIASEIVSDLSRKQVG
jgi:transketolase